MAGISFREEETLAEKVKQYPVLYDKQCRGYKGIGVFTTVDFQKGDYLLEYKGEFISAELAEHRATVYEREKAGCFIYHNVKDIFGKSKCLDASCIDGMGKMVNDSPQIYCNSVMKREVVNGEVHLCLFAKQDIYKGTELRYDYGEEEDCMPWRKLPSCLKPQTEESQMPHFTCSDSEEEEFSLTAILKGLDVIPTSPIKLRAVSSMSTPVSKCRDQEGDLKQSAKLGEPQLDTDRTEERNEKEGKEEHQVDANRMEEGNERKEGKEEHQVNANRMEERNERKEGKEEHQVDANQMEKGNERKGEKGVHQLDTDRTEERNEKEGKEEHQVDANRMEEGNERKEGKEEHQVDANRMEEGNERKGEKGVHQLDTDRTEEGNERKEGKEEHQVDANRMEEGNERKGEKGVHQLDTDRMEERNEKEGKEEHQVDANRMEERNERKEGKEEHQVDANPMEEGNERKEGKEEHQVDANPMEEGNERKEGKGVHQLDTDRTEERNEKEGKEEHQVDANRMEEGNERKEGKEEHQVDTDRTEERNEKEGKEEHQLDANRMEEGNERKEGKEEHQVDANRMEEGYERKEGKGEPQLDTDQMEERNEKEGKEEHQVDGKRMEAGNERKEGKGERQGNGDRMVEGKEVGKGKDGEGESDTLTVDLRIDGNIDFFVGKIDSSLSTTILDKENQMIDRNHVLKDQEEAFDLTTPIDDSGFLLERSLSVIASDEDRDEEQVEIIKSELQSDKDKDEEVAETRKPEVGKTYQKPARPCFLCGKLQTRLKRHILTKHSKEKEVVPLMTMNAEEQNRHIERFRKMAIKNVNMDLLKCATFKSTKFVRERASKNEEVPVMCSGCNGFYARSYKARHQRICPASGCNLMVPVVSVDKVAEVENQCEEFKDLLNTLQLDIVGQYIKTDDIILMIGSRSFSALRKKKDKLIEARKSVRARIRLTARLYLTFREIYSKQSIIKLADPLTNAADMYRRESITLLGTAINEICTKEVDENCADDGRSLSITDQKSGLKVSIFNLLKLTGKFLIGHFLMKNDDVRSKQVTDFLQVLKLMENELFGDAYYDLNFRRNVAARKPANLPSEDDMEIILKECRSILSSTVLDFPSASFTTIRSAAATYLVIFNGRRGGEPVRLCINQWEEALKGDWVDKNDIPSEFNSESMLITFQTGKGADHLVPVIFPADSVAAMKYLVDPEVRRIAGVNPKNNFIFASTKNSLSHVIGWHCVNEILQRVSLAGKVNATKNRHRIASLLARLELPENEKQLIFKHFGHSQSMNENVYQVAAGSLHLKNTGQRLRQIQESSATITAKVKQTDVAKNSESSATITAKEKQTDVAKNSESSATITAKEKQTDVAKNSVNEPGRNTEANRKRKVHENDSRSRVRKYPKRNSKKEVIYTHEDMDTHEDMEDVSDDEDESYQPPVELDEDDDDVSEDVTAPHKPLLNSAGTKGRKTKVWSKDAIDHFNQLFGDYLKQDRGYPARKSMEDFSLIYNLTYLQVRTRIINTRRLGKTKLKRLGAEMNIF